ncbi:MAG: class I SAM-dependent methyltransferase [Chloroflexota bacterium]
MKVRLRWRRRVRGLAGRLPLIGARWHAVRGRRWLLELLPVESAGAEIGVWQGDFSASILAVVRPARLHLVDPWRSAESAHAGALFDRPQTELDDIAESVRRRFAPQIATGRVVVHRQMSLDAVAEFGDASLDWVYVDGDHAYGAVRADIAAYAVKVRPGGHVCGDDYRPGGRYGGGVKRAVDEVVAAGALELVVQRDRQFVLRVPVT